MFIRLLLVLLPFMVFAKVPLTEEQVEEFLVLAEEKLANDVEEIVTLAEEQIEIYWERLGNSILADYSLLTYLSFGGFPSSQAAGRAIFRYNYALNDKLFTNEALYGIGRKIAESKKPYLFLKGEAQEKEGAQGAFTVFSVNTCFVPGEHPYIFGGVVLPWQKRVEPLAEKILEVDADVVCLQEIFSEDATHALHQKLKGHYAYFYGAIGPRVAGFSIDTLGASSGLFIASKYPIKDPRFNLFKASGGPVNMGFFDFVVMDGQTPIGHIYTTHMQPLDLTPFPYIRSLQLQEILEKMKQDRDPLPQFLCGDLNIPRDSEEMGVSLIKKHFYDAYHDDYVHTCTNYFTNHYFSDIKDLETADPGFKILDYALLLPNEQFNIETELVEMNELSSPEEAISDHHGLLTTVTFPQEYSLD